MALHIIIDGVDKVGKTTVCKLLSKKLQIPVIKLEGMQKFFDKCPEEVSEVFSNTVHQFESVSFILDRGFPSSLVYSKYFNRKYDFAYIDENIVNFNARIFILDVAARDDDELIIPKQQKDIRQLYLKFANEYGWEIINCEKLTPEEICCRILKSL